MHAMRVRLCAFVHMSVSIHCLSLLNDDVEIKHFWPAYLPRCGDWFAGVTVVFCPTWMQQHKTALSSTEQMVLYGVGSVYCGNIGQKVLSVEWFLSMEAKHIHICQLHPLHIPYEVS